MSVCPLGRCDGSGKISYKRENIDPPVDLGGGLVLQGGTEYGSELCPCRLRARPVDGPASWWTSRQAYHRVWTGAVFKPTAEVSVRVEVPVTADNRIARRDRLNAYYPASVELHVSDPELSWLFPDEARALAALLLEAADVVDALEVPDRCHKCGRYACSCADPAPFDPENIPF